MLDTIVYIHGFGSGPTSAKGLRLKNVCERLEVHYVGVTYNSRCSFSEIYDEINQQLKPLPKLKTLVIGSSLGGYWAVIFANQYELPCLLVNPSLNPRVSLKKYPDAVAVASTYKDSQIPKYGGVALFESGDTVIDYQLAQHFLEKAITTRVYDGGSHAFDNIDEIEKYVLAINNGVKLW